MKMDSNLGRGFYEVYNSSKEILKNNQKHLYHSMLDLLASTSKSTPAAVVGKILRSDEFVRFWIEDILPLAFDEDATIQGSAINALEQGLLALDISNIPNGSCWNGVKNKIVKEYAPRVHQLREDRSQYWHRVWCILIRLLDREILKSASTINLFLSIVELGFRSPDNSVRAEAFTCWRLLIQIFANHNQLTSPKRLKLVCIPLKSSQSKTPYVAAVKLRIWWYLITCLGPQINENFENVVETFLIFCFGSESKGTPGIIQQYLSVRELALTCLATIVSKEQDDFLQRLLREYEMEPLAQNTQIVNSNIIENFGKSIFYAVFEASNLLIENGKQSDLELRLLNVIIKNSTRILINNDIASLFEYFCEGLRQITEKSCIPIKIVADVIGTEGLRFSHSLSDFDNYIKILHYLVQFLTSGREFISHNIIQQCISQISNLDAFISKNMCWRAVEVIADYLVNMLNDEDFVYFEIKFLIWRHISSEMVNTIRNKTFGRTADEFIDILISWSLWPLRMVTEFTGRRNTTIFDEHFYLLWHNLLQLSENTVGRMQLLTEVAEVLSTMLRSDYEWGVFVNLFNAYADEVMKHDCANYSKHYEQLFLILQEVIQKKLPSKEKEKLLTIFRCVLHGLKTPDSSLLESIKCSLKHVIRNSSKGGVNSKFYEEWKHSILNIVRAFIDKNFTNQVTELFKDDVYVIIPSVWSLKPEKLTDRQKERIAEKTSIPALYNDMSQSQDSLIKPWTPKKIVIAKEDQNEIIIEGLNMRRNQNISTVRDEFQNKTSLDISSSHKNIGAVPSTSKENLETLLNNSIDKSNMEMDHNKPQEVNAKKCNSKEANEIDDEDLTPIINSKVSQAVNNESYPRCITEDSIRAAPNDFRDNHLMNCVESNETESVNTASVSESVKEASPKKSSTKNSLLLSPPDRKLTNNNSSPKLRPKPPAHLTGRGAQLINMIRNRKMDAQSPQTPMPRLFVAKTDSIDRTVPDMDITVVEHTSTP
uniref:Telomere-associated protein RIF1 n=1 Tax=Ceratitis capitata TaxID=7213 RepID=W8C4U5_CERCA